MQDENWLAGFALLERYGLSWDLRVPAWHLEEAADVARAFPRVAIVLNHTGFPWDRSPEGLELWRRGMAALAGCPNVSVKLSCLCLPDGPWREEDNGPLVRDTVRLFGADRCMFASNFPMDGLRIGFDDMMSAYKRMVRDLPGPGPPARSSTIPPPASTGSTPDPRRSGTTCASVSNISIGGTVPGARLQGPPEPRPTPPAGYDTAANATPGRFRPARAKKSAWAALRGCAAHAAAGNDGGGPSCRSAIRPSRAVRLQPS